MTLSLPADNSTGDLVIALSQSADATQGWTFSALRGVCANVNSSFPSPDQPILGYNQTFVAVVLRCLHSGGAPPAGTDQLILFTPSTMSLFRQESAPFFNARPSRDISGAGGENLFLVAPEVPVTTPPYVSVTTVAGNGNFVGPGPGGATLNSPTNGVVGTPTNFALAPHDNCGVSSTCEVNLEDDRITGVILQKGNDGNHYLLTSFHAGDTGNNTVQSLYFVGQVESFASGGQWNGWNIDGPNFWAGYPTITMDPDFDTSFSFTTFMANSTIYPNWYLFKGFLPSDNSFSQNPPLLGYGILGSANSTGSYTGQQSCPPSPTPTATATPSTSSQRWGDYMTMLWDPNYASPNENGAFWTIQEYTTGGSNESTQWAQLADPLPYYVSSFDSEGECNPNSMCTVRIQAPPGVQSGDMLMVNLDLGSVSSSNPTVPARLDSLANLKLGHATEPRLPDAEQRWVRVRSFNVDGSSRF